MTDLKIAMTFEKKLVFNEHIPHYLTSEEGLSSQWTLKKDTYLADLVNFAIDFTRLRIVDSQLKVLLKYIHISYGDDEREKLLKLAEEKEILVYRLPSRHWKAEKDYKQYRMVGISYNLIMALLTMVILGDGGGVDSRP